MQSELLKCNEFELFNLRPSFVIDVDLLNQKYIELQHQYHPDNFTNQNSDLYTQALQLSALINSAYTTLNSPLLRSLCLLRLYGLELDLSNDTQLPMQFIILQMEAHETLHEAKMTEDVETLEHLEKNIKIQQSELIHRLTIEFVNKNFIEAKELTKQLSFYNKLLANVNDTINNLY